MFVTSLLLEKNLFVKHGKCPKNGVNRDLFKRKKTKIFWELHLLTPTRALPWTQKGAHSTPPSSPPRTPAAFYMLYNAWIGIPPN